MSDWGSNLSPELRRRIMGGVLEEEELGGRQAGLGSPPGVMATLGRGWGGLESEASQRAGGLRSIQVASPPPQQDVRHPAGTWGGALSSPEASQMPTGGGTWLERALASLPNTPEGKARILEAQGKRPLRMGREGLEVFGGEGYEPFNPPGFEWKDLAGLIGTVPSVIGGIGGSVLGSFVSPVAGTVAGGGAGSGAGEYARQWMGRQFGSGEETDWENVGWEAALGLGGEVVGGALGKVVGGVFKRAREAPDAQYIMARLKQADKLYGTNLAELAPPDVLAQSDALSHAMARLRESALGGQRIRQRQDEPFQRELEKAFDAARREQGPLPTGREAGGELKEAALETKRKRVGVRGEYYDEYDALLPAGTIPPLPGTYEAINKIEASNVMARGETGGAGLDKVRKAISEAKDIRTVADLRRLREAVGDEIRAANIDKTQLSRGALSQLQTLQRGLGDDFMEFSNVGPPPVRDYLGAGDVGSPPAGFLEDVSVGAYEDLVPPVQGREFAKPQLETGFEVVEGKTIPLQKRKPSSKGTREIGERDVAVGEDAIARERALSAAAKAPSMSPSQVLRKSGGLKANELDRITSAVDLEKKQRSQLHRLKNKEGGGVTVEEFLAEAMEDKASASVLLQAGIHDAESLANAFRSDDFFKKFKVEVEESFAPEELQYARSQMGDLSDEIASARSVDELQEAADKAQDAYRSGIIDETEAQEFLDQAEDVAGRLSGAAPERAVPSPIRPDAPLPVEEFPGGVPVGEGEYSGRAVVRAGKKASGYAKSLFELDESKIVRRLLDPDEKLSEIPDRLRAANADEIRNFRQAVGVESREGGLPGFDLEATPEGRKAWERVIAEMLEDLKAKIRSPASTQKNYIISGAKLETELLSFKPRVLEEILGKDTADEFLEFAEMAKTVNITKGDNPSGTARGLDNILKDVLGAFYQPRITAGRIVARLITERLGARMLASPTGKKLLLGTTRPQEWAGRNMNLIENLGRFGGQTFAKEEFRPRD